MKHYLLQMEECRVIRLSVRGRDLFEKFSVYVPVVGEKRFRSLLSVPESPRPVSQGITQRLPIS